MPRLLDCFTGSSWMFAFRPDSRNLRPRGDAELRHELLVTRKNAALLIESGANQVIEAVGAVGRPDLGHADDDGSLGGVQLHQVHRGRLRVQRGRDQQVRSALALVAALDRSGLGAASAARIWFAPARRRTLPESTWWRQEERFSYEAIILSQIPNGSVRVLIHSLKAIFSPWRLCHQPSAVKLMSGAATTTNCRSGAAVRKIFPARRVW